MCDGGELHQAFDSSATPICFDVLLLNQTIIST